MDSNTCTQKSPKNQGSDLQLIWLQLMSHRRRCAVLKDAQVHYLQLLFPNADLYCVKGASNSFLRNLDGRRRLPSTRKDVYGPGYTSERFGDFAGDAWFPKLVRRTQNVFAETKPNIGAFFIRGREFSRQPLLQG
jgi:hypothetical protein